MKKLLTIAGSDCSGGAGIQTDLKTFAACGVYGMSVITAITAQNTLGVEGVENISSNMIALQIKAVFDDIEVDGVKIGMLANKDIIDTIFNMLSIYKPKNLVIDPVMISTSGFDLINTEAKQILIEKLLPLADLITPNLSEAKCILYHIDKNFSSNMNNSEDMVRVATAISNYTGGHVLIKGGHLDEEACDVLVKKDGSIHKFTSERINTKNTHGTGCTLSSAICSYMAKGYSLEESISKGKIFITNAIKNSLDIGSGCGPTNPMGEIYRLLEEGDVCFV